jgi:hypothetical protein
VYLLIVFLSVILPMLFLSSKLKINLIASLKLTESRQPRVTGTQQITGKIKSYTKTNLSTYLKALYTINEQEPFTQKKINFTDA